MKKNVENILIQVKLNILGSNTDYMLEGKWSLSPVSCVNGHCLPFQYNDTVQHIYQKST